MIIQTGIPTETGPYVCYMHGVRLPTVIRHWRADGSGWLTANGDSIVGSVAGWIGPLPLNDEKPLPPVEYDL